MSFALGTGVVSFNGATRLILGYEFTHSGFKQALRLSIGSELSLTHSSRTRLILGFRFPLGPHFRDYLVFTSVGVSSSGERHAVPSRNMAQQRTNKLLPTATMAIFRRDFLPPLMR